MDGSMIKAPVALAGGEKEKFDFPRDGIAGPTPGRNCHNRCLKRTFTLRVEGRPDLFIHRTLEELVCPFSPFEFDLPDGLNKIFLSADGPIARLGNDPRNIRIGVRDLSGLSLSE